MTEIFKFPLTLAEAKLLAYAVDNVITVGDRDRKILRQARKRLGLFIKGERVWPGGWTDDELSNWKNTKPKE